MLYFFIITFVKLFRPKAVTNAPLVARAYEVPNCLLKYNSYTIMLTFFKNTDVGITYW